MTTLISDLMVGYLAERQQAMGLLGSKLSLQIARNHNHLLLAWKGNVSDSEVKIGWWE